MTIRRWSALAFLTAVPFLGPLRLSSQVAPQDRVQGSAGSVRPIVEGGPATSSVRFLVDQQEGAIGGTVVLKRASDQWQQGFSISLGCQHLRKGAICRFLLPIGRWDIAILLRGYAPVFRENLEANAKAMTISPVTLTPGVTLKAAIRDAESGRRETTWSAFALGDEGSHDAATLTFFAQRPIGGGRRLDFGSLPVGRWDIRFVSPSHPELRRRIVTETAGTTDLGRVFLGRPGALRLAIQFADHPPSRPVSVSIARPGDPKTGAQVQPLITREYPGSLQITANFDELAPGPVLVLVATAAGDVAEKVEVGIRGGELATVALVLREMEIVGVVRRGARTVPEAGLQLRHNNHRLETKSSPNGEYHFTAWRSADSQYLLVTKGPGDRVGYYESLQPPDDLTTLLRHDVDLPTSVLRGRLLDAARMNGVASGGVTLRWHRSGPAWEDMAVTARVPAEADGTFVLENLPDEPIDILGTAPGYASARLAGLMPGQAPELNDLLLARESTISGRIVDEKGSPLNGVMIGYGSDLAGHYFERSTTSNDAGQFVLNGLPTGFVSLVTAKCGFPIQVVTTQSTSATSGTSLPLGHRRTPLRILFRHPDGTPAAGLSIQPTIADVTLPSQETAAFAKSCGRPSASDGTGELLVDALPEGRLSITVLDELQRPVATHVEINRGSTWVITVPD